MTDKTNNSLTPVATQPGRPPVNQPAPSPVRVKLRRVNANLATPYPPDGESKVWWKRLKKALGTKSANERRLAIPKERHSRSHSI